jgi:hypothetical protein
MKAIAALFLEQMQENYDRLRAIVRGRQSPTSPRTISSG